LKTSTATSSWRTRETLPNLWSSISPKPAAISPEPATRIIDLGIFVCNWIEDTLVHGEGDYLGKQFLLDPWEEYLIRLLYLVDAETGRRIVRRGFWVLPKGNGKTEIVGAVMDAELAGPVMWRGGHAASRSAPNIPVAAASYEQSDRLFGAAAELAGNDSSGLAPYVEVLEHEIRLLRRKGRLFRVAAVAGTNDGGLPTAFGADEVHEWLLPKQRRVHLVIGSSLAKRDQGLELSISTPDDATPDSLFGTLFSYGMRVASGEIVDPSFLFAWWTAPKDVDLEDPVALRAAVRQANPGSWLDLERVAARFEIDRIPPHEFRRYNLGQLVRPERAWLPEGKWEALEKERPLEDGEPVVLGFDGSYNHDSTALVGCTMDRHLFVVDCWERPDHAPDGWAVPRAEVDAAVNRAFLTWQVVEMACDRAKWAGEIQEWVERYGEEVVIDFPQSAARMVPACGRFYGAVVQGEGMSHDGDPRLARHLHNAVAKEHRSGTHITKETSASPRKIDLAVAAVMAYERAMYHAGETEEGPLIAWA